MPLLEKEAAKDFDRSKLGKKVREYLEHLESLEVIPPKNGVEYAAANNNYHIGEEKKVRLNERQVNLATLLANDRSIDPLDAYVIAGYGFYSAFTSANSTYDHLDLKRVQGHLKTRYNRTMSKNCTSLMNHIRTDAAAEICIDAQWILSESVSLYEECRRKGQYTQAVRLLHDLSYHVDIDSRVSNKIEVSQTLDYAALLNEADARTAIEDKGSEVIETDFQVIEEPVSSH